MQGSVPRSGGLATPYLEVWRGLDCVKPHLTAAAAQPTRPLSLVRLAPPSTNHRAAGPGGGDGDGSISGRFFLTPRAARVRDRGQMGKFFSFIFLETPLVGRDRKIEGGLVDTRASLFMAAQQISVYVNCTQNHIVICKTLNLVFTILFA